MNSYALVVLKLKNSVGIASSSWLEGDRTFWPPYDTQDKIDAAVKKHEKPTYQWKVYEVEILDVAVSYDEALRKLPLAQTRSDRDNSKGTIPSRAKKRSATDSDSEDHRDDTCVAESSTDRQQSVTESSELLPSPRKQSKPGPTLSTLCTSVDSNIFDMLETLKQNGCTTDTRSKEYQDTMSPSSEGSLSTQEHVFSGHAVEIEEPSDFLNSVLDAKRSDLNVTRVIMTLLTDLASAVTSLQSQVALNTRLLQSLSAAGVADTTTTEQDPGIDLPISDKVSLTAIEKQLKEDESISKPLVTMLARIGGKTVREVTRRIMSSLFSNSLVMKCNWTGQGGKIAFGKLKIADIIRKAVRKNPHTTEATDFDIQHEVVRYLHGALDRDGGRQRRSKSKDSDSDYSVLFVDVAEISKLESAL